MKLLNELCARNLRLNKKRTIVTIVGIMLSVALITAVASVFSSGLYSLTEFEMLRSGRYHAVLYDVPAGEVAELAQNRSIQTLNLTENIGYAAIDSRNEDKPYVFIKGLTDDSLKNLVTLSEGRLPENNREIVIPTHLRSSGRVILSVGDTITLAVGRRVSAEGEELGQGTPLMVADENREVQEQIVDTVPVTYTIVGIMETPQGSMEFYSAPGYTLVTRVLETDIRHSGDVYVRFTKKGLKRIWKNLAGILGIDEKLFIKYNTGEELSEEEERQISMEIENARYAFSYNAYLVALETDPLGLSSVGRLVYAVWLVIAIIVLTSVFCISNSFDISITEKIRQYGMLRSIGATKKQIRQNVFFEAALLGLAGIPLGLICGLLASFILVHVSNYYVTGMFYQDFSLSYSFSPAANAVAILLGIVTVGLSARRSAIKASRITPLDSIRNSAKILVTSKNLRSPRVIRKLFGIGGEISYKNLRRNRKKYRTTVISITVSVILFISLSSFMKMAFGAVDRDIDRSEYNISVSATFEDSRTFQRLADTAHFDHIEDYSMIRNAGMEFTGVHYTPEYCEWHMMKPKPGETEHISVISLGDEQYAKYLASIGLKPEEVKDRAILCDYDTCVKYDEDNNRVSRYMRQYDFQAGDTIKGITENALTQNRMESEIEIAAVTDKRPFGMKNWSTPYLVVSDAMFDRIAETRWVMLVYRTDDSSWLQDKIEDYLKGISCNINNNDDVFREMNNLFTLASIFLYGFIIVITMIGITNMINTITTNMELRKPEFAMLRSIGMTNREFGRMIRLESLFMGLRSLLVGIPAGILLSYGFYFFLAEESGQPFRLPVNAILLTAAAVFVLIFLIMSYSMSRIRKQNIIETIRNENI